MCFRVERLMLAVFGLRPLYRVRIGRRADASSPSGISPSVSALMQHVTRMKLIPAVVLLACLASLNMLNTPNH
jgi:hypothetical protein